MVLESQNLCGVHAVKKILSCNGYYYSFEFITNALRKESKAMLKENKLDVNLSGVKTKNNFNVEAIERLLRKIGFNAVYFHFDSQNFSFGKNLIVSNNNHWLAVVIKKNYAKIYSDNSKKIFSGKLKNAIDFLRDQNYKSGLKF